MSRRPRPRARTREALDAIARDAADRVERATGTPAYRTRAVIRWALEDAEPRVLRYSTGRLYAEAVAIPVVVLAVVAVFVWCWP